ncbi:MAG: hypothetical protein RLO17_01195 [Cyclobacteriaceae bacterium]
MSENIAASNLITSPEVLFQTSNASVSQCDAQGKYILTFAEDQIVFRACELISFRRKIQKIDITQLLASDTPDVEIISMPHCDRLFVFTIQEILELRDLFAGTFAMLELNSLIHKEIIRKGALIKSN